MDEQSAQIGVAELGYPEQPSPATRTVLSRDQPEPGAEVSGLGKAACIAHCRDQSRRVKYPDSGDRGQSACGGIITCQLDKLIVQRFDLRVKLPPFGT